MIATFCNGLDELYRRAKFGKIVKSAPAVGVKIMVFVCFFCFYVTLRGQRVVHSTDAQFEHVLCHGYWIDFDAVYDLFQNRQPFQMHYIILIFVASLCAPLRVYS